MYVSIYVCPPVRPPSDRMEQVGYDWTDVREILLLEHFSKICRGNSSFISI